MKRGTFLAGAAVATFAPRLAGAQAIRVGDIVNSLPGVAGVVARTMDGGPPEIAVNAQQQFPSASVIKVAIMATVYRAYDEGSAHPGKQIRMRADDMIGGSDVTGAYPPGTLWTIDALVKAMIHVSDNSASNALITAFGMKAINTTMRSAGMMSSHLGRHFADVVPAWHISQNVVTPADVATLLYQIERGARESVTTIATPASCRAMIDVMLGNDDGSKIVRGLPRRTPCAHKTGEITGLRNDAGIVDPFGDVPYVLVVLTKELQDQGAGDDAIAAIAHRVDHTLRG